MATDDEIARLLRDAAPPTARGVDFSAVQRGASRRRTQGLASGVAALVLVLGGGTALAASGLLKSRDAGGSDVATVPEPSAPPSAPSAPSVTPSVPPPSPTATALSSPLLLLGGTDTPTLVSVGRDGSTTSRVLPGPGDARTNATDATLSSGANPLACVIWSGTGPPLENQVRCYPGGQGPGTVIAGIGPSVGPLALRADGKMLAWAEDRPAPFGARDIYAADFDGQRISNVRRSEPEPGKRYEGGLPISPGKIAWAGNDTLLLSLVADGDEGSGLVRLPLAGFDGGWLKRPRIAPAAVSGYDFYVLAGSSDGATVLAVEVASFFAGDQMRPPSRAVRVDLASGRLLEVIATAAEGREVLSVVGDGETVVYATGNGDPASTRYYLRAKGADRLTLTGLSGTPVGYAS